VYLEPIERICWLQTSSSSAGERTALHQLDLKGHFQAGKTEGKYETGRIKGKVGKGRKRRKKTLLSPISGYGFEQTEYS